MRALLQRVESASVAADGETVGAIGPGLLVLAGVRRGDTAEDAEWIAGKIATLRIFPDEARLMNRSVVETGGSILLVPQFTLYGDARKGRRPSYEKAARPEEAIPLLDALKRHLEAAGLSVATGCFGAHMRVELVNDGPVTLLLDSEERRGGRGRAASPAPAGEEGAGAAAAGRVPAGTARETGAPKSRAGERAASGETAAGAPVGASRSTPAPLSLLEEGSPLRACRLVLASASPRRRRLLEELGVAFAVDPPEVDEEADLPEGPAAGVRALAERKAREVAGRRPEGLVLAADTIVVRGGRIFGKPADEAEAERMLRELAGREHRVLTGVSVAGRGGALLRSRVVETRVRFRALEEGEIRRYVASGEPFGKAGGYAIQGKGRLLVAGIEGDYTNVVGLPLGAALELLEEVLELASVQEERKEADS